MFSVNSFLKSLSKVTNMVGIYLNLSLEDPVVLAVRVIRCVLFQVRISLL